MTEDIRLKVNIHDPGKFDYCDVRGIYGSKAVDDTKVEPDVWVESAAQAFAFACNNPRQPKYPPHHLRCDFMRNGTRCCKGADHPGDHEEPKP